MSVRQNASVCPAAFQLFALMFSEAACCSALAARSIRFGLLRQLVLNLAHSLDFFTCNLTTMLFFFFALELT